VKKRLTVLVTEPLVQFLIIGAMIYGAYALFGTPEEDFRDTKIHVDANRINAFISEWEARWNRPPTRQEIDGVIQSYIREDVLYRQAVEMGLNEDDPITRRRMAQKLEFLTSDLALMVQPAEGELKAFFLKNQATYQSPDRITFSHLFFNPDRRENTALADAAEALVTLQAAGEPSTESMQNGDPFMLHSDFVSVTGSEIARQMGNRFSEAVMKLQPGQWHGPVLSGYGVHLVYVFEYIASPPVTFEEVEAAVLEDWQVNQREVFNADFLKNLKNRYEIVIDEIPEERILKSPGETVSIEETTEAAGS
jgi:hypothetical protein